jgi:hypothetical protein
VHSRQKNGQRITNTTTHAQRGSGERSESEENRNGRTQRAAHLIAAVDGMLAIDLAEPLVIGIG